MKILQNCIKLSCSIKIYVPSTVNVEEKFDNSEVVNSTLGFLTDKFGGATATNALGVYKTVRGEKVAEDITLVFAYADQEQLNENIKEVYDFCVNMRENLKQETIGLEINGEFYLV